MSNQNTETMPKAINQVMNVISLGDLGVDSSRLQKSSVGFSLAVRSLLQNWRQGTVACKGRSDVNRTNKKPWKQKGTGRARAGSARSPLWRGGGVIFGPQERTRQLKITKQTRKNAFMSLLFDFAENQKIICLDWTFVENKPSTKTAYNQLRKAQLDQSNITLFLSPDDFITRASFMNIPTVRVLFFDQPNAFELASTHYWVFLQKDKNQFQEMVARWL